jgi:hypothetical protein
LPDEVLTFVVVSSRSGETYHLKAQRAPGGVRFTCTCAAGENGSYCRHRLDLLAGVVGELRSGSAADVQALAVWAQGTALEQSIAEMAALEKAQADLKRRLSAVKKAIGRLLLSAD